MNDLNMVVLVGRLTKDPEHKMAGTTSLCKFTVASNYKYKEKEHVDFIEVVTWAGLADTCQKFLAKGSQVIIEGRLTQETWETKEKEKRSKITVTANHVQFVGVRKDSASKDAGNVGATSIPDETNPFG